MLPLVLRSPSLVLQKSVKSYNKNSQLIHIHYLTPNTYFLAALNEFVYGNYSIFVLVHFLYLKKKIKNMNKITNYGNWVCVVKIW